MVNMTLRLNILLYSMGSDLKVSVLYMQIEYSFLSVHIYWK